MEYGFKELSTELTYVAYGIVCCELAVSIGLLVLAILTSTDTVFYTFLLQFPHAFLWALILAANLGEKTQFYIMVLAFIFSIFAVIGDIGALLIRFVYSLVVLSNLYYWILLFLNIAAISIVTISIIVHLIHLFYYPMGTEEKSTQLINSTMRYRSRIDLLWLLELLFVAGLTVLWILDVDPIPSYIFYFHLPSLAVWPFNAAIAGQRFAGLPIFGAVLSPSVLLFYMVIYGGLVWIPAITAFFFKVTALLLLVFYLGYPLLTIGIPITSVALTGMVLIFSTIILSSQNRLRATILHVKSREVDTPPPQQLAISSSRRRI